MRPKNTLEVMAPFHSRATCVSWSFPLEINAQVLKRDISSGTAVKRISSFSSERILVTYGAIELQLLR